MKKNWEMKKLGEICTVIAGQSPEGRFYNESGDGLPFYQGKKEFGERYIGKPTTWTSKITKEAVKGDILMSVRAPVGPVNFATEKICIGRGLAAIRSGKNIIPDYLFYCLSSMQDTISGREGAVFASINKSEIEKLEIPIPPLAEQQHIVAVLDKAFAAIATAKEYAERNLQNSKELFQSYLHNVFANKGEGWEEKKLGKLCEINPRRSVINRSDIMPTTFVPMSAVDEVNGIIAHPAQRPYSDVKKGYTFFIENDVIFAKITPCMQNGKQAIARNLIDGIGFGSTEFHVIRPNEKIMAEWIWYFVRQSVILQTATKFFKGTVGQQRVPDSYLKILNIPLPPLVEQQRIVAKLEALSEQTKNLESIYRLKIADLEELKKSILQKAFNGEL